jgi:protein-S-isoprenylcysteine O-methyltransferase Ste14
MVAGALRRSGRRTPPERQAHNVAMSRAHPRRWLVAGYAGLGGFFAIEAVIRQRGSASSLAASEDDRDSTTAIVRAYQLSACLPLVLRGVAPGSLPRAAQPLGLALQASGLALRVWSMRTLGSNYSRTLRTQGEQAVVDTGPYRLVRHPGYLGSLLIWTGFALTSRSLPVVAGVSGLMARAYAARIDAEEQLLVRDLPGYSEYSQRTRKLIPLIW